MEVGRSRRVARTRVPAIALPMARRVGVVGAVAAVVLALIAQRAVAIALPGAIAEIVGTRGLGPTSDVRLHPPMPPTLVAASLLAILGAAAAFPAPRLRPGSLGPLTRDGLSRVSAAAALLIVPALVAAMLWSQEDFAAAGMFTLVSSSWAALLWLAGLAAALVVLWPRQRGATGALPERWQPAATPAGARPARRRLPRTRPASNALLVEAAALLAVLALAAVLRIWRLGTLPEGIWFDETDSAASAVRLLHLPFQPFAPGTIGHLPSLYYYLMAALVALGGNTIAMVRLTSALFGVLAVLAVYLIGRQAGGVALGLSAAALLAVAQWAIDFSRLGMPNIAAPAMLGLSVAALVAAMRWPRAFWFAACGILLGLTLLTYQGGYLSAAAVLAALALRLVGDGAFRRAAWPGVLLAPLGLAAGAAPLLLMLLIAPGYTLDRITTVSLLHQYPRLADLLPALLDNMRRHLEMFTWAGDGNGRHNLPGAPMLDAVSGACLLLGLGLALRRAGQWFYQILLLWLGAGLLGGMLSLSFEAPQGARTIGAIAPIALLAALPLAALAERARSLARIGGRRIPRTGRRTARDVQAGAAAVAVALVPLGAAYAADTAQYFVLQQSSMASWLAMGGRETIMGRATAALERQGFTVRIDPGVDPGAGLAYTAGTVPPAYDPTTPVPLPLPPGGLALIIPTENTAVYAAVRRVYPRAELRPLAPDFAGAPQQATIVLIRARDVARILGLTVTVQSRSHRLVLTHLHGAVAWPPGSPAAASVRLAGTLLLGQAEAWQPVSLRVVGARWATITLDGQTWQAGQAGTPRLRLGAGAHSLAVTAVGPSGPAVELQWTLPGGPRRAAAGGNLWYAPPPTTLEEPGLATGGLLGLYYISPAIAGEPTMARVDAPVDTYFQNPPVGALFPFSARWLGTLLIARAGAYAFNLESVGPSRLYIDGHPVIASGAGLGSRTGLAVLARGRHALRLDYNATGEYLHCYLTWAPPGRQFGPIPPQVTLPASGI